MATDRIIKSLNKMNVYDPMKVFMELSSDTYDIAKYFNNSYSLVGGGEKLKMYYKGESFIIYKTKRNNNRQFHIYPNNDEKRHDYCIFIIFDLDEKFIRLDTIAYNKNCFSDINRLVFGEKNCNGTQLLKMALHFINTINKNYKLGCITLKDNAFKDCGDLKISVSRLHVLIDGNTWYGRYGFLPKDQLENKVDDDLLKKYKKNIKIIKKAKVSDIDFENIYKKIYSNKQNEKYLKNIELNKLLKITKERKDDLMSNYFKNMLISFDIYCGLFYLIYMRVYNELELYDFHGKPFIMML